MIKKNSKGVKIDLTPESKQPTYHWKDGRFVKVSKTEKRG